MKSAKCWGGGCEKQVVFANRPKKCVHMYMYIVKRIGIYIRYTYKHIYNINTRILKVEKNIDSIESRLKHLST